MSKAMNPLPSLIRASAQDAANAQMRAANRKKWDEADYDLACATQRRLTLACYGKPGENQREMAFIRFQVAEQWQRKGLIGLDSQWDDVLAEIDRALSA
jgi:hypothetical protein